MEVRGSLSANWCTISCYRPLVHKDQKGHVVVIGVFVDMGSPNQSLADIWAMLPMKAGELGSEHLFNPQALIPSNSHHFPTTAR